MSVYPCVHVLARAQVLGCACLVDVACVTPEGLESTHPYPRRAAMCRRPSQWHKTTPSMCVTGCGNCSVSRCRPTHPSRHMGALPMEATMR
jgi:hypothetical protein